MASSSGLLANRGRHPTMRPHAGDALPVSLISKGLLQALGNSLNSYLRAMLNMLLNPSAYRCNAHGLQEKLASGVAASVDHLQEDASIIRGNM